MLNKILFFGNERLATGTTTSTPILRALIANGYRVQAIIVAQNNSGKSRNPRDTEIVQLANEHKIPVFAPNKLSDIADDIKGFQADIAVLAAYGKIVPQSIIDLFPHGIVNIHPSLLPKHRGSIPIEGVILNGEAETGVSLMQLVAKMDAGPVYKKQQVSVPKNVSKQQLATQLQELGSRLLIKNLPAILDQSLQPKLQEESAATYDSRITKEQSQLDFSKPAGQLEREIRAFAGWPRSRTRINDIDVIVTSSEVSDEQGTPGAFWHNKKQLGVYCSDGNLIIQSLIPNGKNEMPASSFIAGYLR